MSWIATPYFTPKEELLKWHLGDVDSFSDHVARRKEGRKIFTNPLGDAPTVCYYVVNTGRKQQHKQRPNTHSKEYSFT